MTIDERRDRMDRMIFDSMKKGTLIFSDNMTIETLNKLIESAKRLEDCESLRILQDEIDFREYFSNNT